VWGATADFRDFNFFAANFNPRSRVGSDSKNKQISLIGQSILSSFLQNRIKKAFCQDKILLINPSYGVRIHYIFMFTYHSH